MSNGNEKRYFVEEGKSLSTKIGNVGPHEEITIKLIGGENPNKMIEKHLKNGLLYEADKPRIDAAAKVKADKNQALKDQVGAVEKLEIANKKIKHLEDKIKDSGDDAIRDELKDTKKELGKAKTALDAAKIELTEASTKLEAAKKDSGEVVTAHDATKKELEDANGNLNASEELLSETQVKLSDTEKALKEATAELKELKKK